MDIDLPRTIERWEGSVRDLSWPSPADSSTWLDCSGYPPSFWRTATLREINRPCFCDHLIRQVKHWLHGRFRANLRRQISETTRARETLREQGKLKKVICRETQSCTQSTASNRNKGS